MVSRLVTSVGHRGAQRMKTYSRPAQKGQNMPAEIGRHAFQYQRVVGKRDDSSGIPPSRTRVSGDHEEDRHRC